MDDLEKEVFDLFPHIGFVLHLEELFHFFLAEALLSFRRVVSVDESQKRSRVLVVPVDFLRRKIELDRLPTPGIPPPYPATINHDVATFQVSCRQ